MTNTADLANQLTQARNELNNLRKRMQGLQAQHRKDVSRLEKLLQNGQMTVDSVERVPHKLGHTDNTSSSLFVNWKPIGHIASWFHTKNGTPRQGSLSSLSRGMLKVDKGVFNNPQHAIEGLQEYSHVWILFVFDQNKDMGRSHGKTKVAPPRLNGQRIGVFATRSPHRPNPLGLTLARLEKIKGDCVYLSGLDILDGTPVLDIKPYIPQYDDPCHVPSYLGSVALHERTDSLKCGHLEDESFSPPGVTSITLSDTGIAGSTSLENITKRVSELEKDSDKTSKTNSLLKGGSLNVCEIMYEKNEEFDLIAHPSDVERLHPDLSNKLAEEQKPHVIIEQQSCLGNVAKAKGVQGVTTPSWLGAPSSTLQVVFNPIAEAQVELFSQNAEKDCYRLEFLGDSVELKAAISSILSEDPRSAYRRQKCTSLLYYFTVDTAHITAWFEEEVAEVLRVCPLHTGIISRGK
ncbi:tRNA (adenine(37)-N6)-methyltransferase [Panulirus ornatus]|uniref:tRNA (adenine(37)-N6)-methyltransferase n=1 Tax=Panulirus ornatus TaxID=150431 RepID=UPI003A860B5D